MTKDFFKILIFDCRSHCHSTLEFPWLEEAVEMQTSRLNVSSLKTFEGFRADFLNTWRDAMYLLIERPELYK